jgi:predicted anti-sigma-YlaC factor YlaD
VTCREFTEFILDYSSRDLSVEVRELFERHLSVCPNCREYLALYLTTVELGRHACDHDEALAVKSGVPEELVAAILAARSMPNRHR